MGVRYLRMCVQSANTRAKRSRDQNTAQKAGLISLLIPCRMACRIASKASSVRSDGIIGQCGALPKAR